MRARTASEILTHRLALLHGRTTVCRPDCLIQELLDVSLGFAEASRTAAIELLSTLVTLDEPLRAAGCSN